MISIEIPNSVTSIGSSAFYYCIGLTEVTIPNSVTSIGYSAFSDCSGLSRINVESGNSKYDSRDNCNAIIETDTNTLIAGCQNTMISNSVTSIGDYAFYGCSGLTSVTIPNSVTSIGYYAFANCSGLIGVSSRISANNLFAIDSSVFYDVDKLTCTLYVPFGAIDTYRATSGWSDFCSFNGLKSEVSGKCGDNADWIFNAETGVLTISGTGAMYDYEYKGSPWNTIRSIIKFVEIENGITSIGDYAFYNCGLTGDLVIPNSVTSIGDYAFCNCGLTGDLVIPNSVTSIGDYAFCNCGLTGDLVIPNSVTSIGDSAFSDCSGLSRINVESGNSKYDSRDNCNAIIESDTNTLIVGCKNTVIPGSVLEIGDFAFDGCSGLTEVTIPDSVTYIGRGAFHDCTGLTSVTIPNSVTAIGLYAFYGCSGLTEVTIGNSVTVIGNEAFYDCAAMTKLYCKAIVPPTCYNYVFDGIDKENCVLYVPQVSIANYQAAEQWKEFFFIKDIESGVEEVLVDGEDYSSAPIEIFNLSGLKVGDSTENLAPGVYIKRQGRKVEKIAIQ